jgi:hypothetical protein
MSPRPMSPLEPTTFTVHWQSPHGLKRDDQHLNQCLNQRLNQCLNQRLNQRLS